MREEGPKSQEVLGTYTAKWSTKTNKLSSSLFGLGSFPAFWSMVLVVACGGVLLLLAHSFIISIRQVLPPPQRAGCQGGEEGFAFLFVFLLVSLRHTLIHSYFSFLFLLLLLPHIVITIVIVHHPSASSYGASPSEPTRQPRRY